MYVINKLQVRKRGNRRLCPLWSWVHLSQGQSPTRRYSRAKLPSQCVFALSSCTTTLILQQFSPDVVNQLSNRLESPETSPERQTVLDAHIRSRIQDELEHLRREEEHVQSEIERALEKENLDKERAMAGDASEGDGSGAGEVRSSAALQGDLEDIRGKISKYQSRKELTEYPEVKSYGDAVVECYRYVNPRPSLSNLIAEQKKSYQTP